MHLNQPNQLIADVASAVALPPRLKVKWLRSDCLKCLDLRGPAVAEVLTVSAWQSLVMCLGAVPDLEALHVQLPRGRMYQTACTANPDTPDEIFQWTFLQGFICTHCHCDVYRRLFLRQTRAQDGIGPAIPSGTYVRFSDFTKCSCVPCGRYFTSGCVRNSRWSPHAALSAGQI